MKYFLLLLALLSFSHKSEAKFDKLFEEKTLRLDYYHCGNATSEQFFFDELIREPHWAGSKINLVDTKYYGTHRLEMRTADTNELIYSRGYGTLFDEWQTTPEAEKVNKSFENSFLIPYPKKEIEVEILLREATGNYKSAIKHTIDPNDILIKKIGLNNLPSYTILHQGGPIDKCVNIAILAEGYTTSEMSKFREHAATACQQILAHNPFGKLKNKLNLFAIETVSLSSGVSVPRENTWKQTAFGSHFDTFYSDRYLTTTNVKDIHNSIAGIPYAHIIILANTDVYGGGGIFNSYTLTTTGHEAFKPVVVHDFGHSFAGLADEYYYENDTFSDTYPFDTEPWEPNITTLVNFDSKWKDLLQRGTPIPTNIGDSARYKTGVYEGAGYSAKGIYRPAIDCRMKTNTCKDFCPACQQSLSKLIKFYTE